MWTVRSKVNVQDYRAAYGVSLLNQSLPIVPNAILVTLVQRGSKAANRAKVRIADQAEPPISEVLATLSSSEARFAAT